MGHSASKTKDTFNSIRSSGRSQFSARSARSSRALTQKSTRQISIRAAEPTDHATECEQASKDSSLPLGEIPTSTSQPPSDASSPLVHISLNIRRHCMTGHGAFRGNTYEFLLRQLLSKTTVALDCIRSYVGASVSDNPQIFINTDYVDFVSNRTWPVPLPLFSQALWNVMTNMPKHAVRKTTALDTWGDNLSYVEVRIESGHRRNVPVVFNVLHMQDASPDGITMVYRSINEDDQYPVPPQTVHVGLVGWYDFAVECH
ncbi:hypothetical protein, variant 1 [Aphanomyces invadans]|uniref:Uncharacterized protein n=1 Tax=Aphanomyces invadans TaxID=157072 RepID=A0A024TUY3_9STRA|nr:hypothetical protein, variant 1 [Aphanomyces invadans]ETV97970.1 hypothetical protein, variant 1 [Aphanomyces invadans]|eukprot:XP_008873531.1 hypothetical protein, variant 1 [Aphanomyces invadans]